MPLIELCGGNAPVCIVPERAVEARFIYAAMSYSGAQQDRHESGG